MSNLLQKNKVDFFWKQAETNSLQWQFFFTFFNFLGNNKTYDDSYDNCDMKHGDLCSADVQIC